MPANEYVDDDTELADGTRTQPVRRASWIVTNLFNDPPPPPPNGGDRTFLTGTNTHDAGSKLRVSCDQERTAAIGNDTRYRSLVLGIRRGTGFGNPQDHTLSWSSNGMPLPAENRPHILFDRLFRPDSKDTIAQREVEFAQRASVLDSVLEDTAHRHKRLGKVDRDKLDEHLTGIRDLEATMQEENRGFIATNQPSSRSTSAAIKHSIQKKTDWITDVISEGCSMLSRSRCKPTARG